MVACCTLTKSQNAKHDMALLFGRNPTEICMIFNYVVDYIYNIFN